MTRHVAPSIAIAVERSDAFVKPGHPPRTPETGLASGQLVQSWPHFLTNKSNRCEVTRCQA
jgi:hypothetical protein